MSLGFEIKTAAQYASEGKTPEVLFYVGCAGSFDERAQKITKAFATILNKVGINYAILGKEEMCTGDPVRRAIERPERELRLRVEDRQAVGVPRGQLAHPALQAIQLRPGPTSATIPRCATIIAKLRPGPKIGAAIVIGHAGLPGSLPVRRRPSTCMV